MKKVELVFVDVGDRLLFVGAFDSELHDCRDSMAEYSDYVIVELPVTHFGKFCGSWLVEDARGTR